MAWTNANALPDGFVRLSAFAPEIEQDMRYVGSFNFLGRRVAGYNAPECILSQPAAAALRRVSSLAVQHGYRLRVHDCYRPQRAVDDFHRWAVQPENGAMKTAFYPRETKQSLFERGYIAKRSGHSRGSTVDLTLVKPDAIDGDLAQSLEANGKACHDNPVTEIEGGLVEMGTRYDCLDVLSATKTQAVSHQAQANRALLLTIMRQAGFRNYRKEWWHFTLNNEPYPKRYFDFSID